MPAMPAAGPDIDALYRDAVRLAEDARSWFDGPGRPWRAALPPAARAAVATQSLAITARLMAVIAWSLDPAHTDPAAAPPPWPHTGFAGIAGLPAPSPPLQLAEATRRLSDRVAALAAPQKIPSDP